VGERVLQGLRKLHDRLHLKVNEGKTAVTSAFGRKFLGYDQGLNRIMPIAYFDRLGVPRLS
jgi:hypothetical protein